MKRGTFEILNMIQRKGGGERVELYKFSCSARVLEKILQLRVTAALGSDATSQVSSNFAFFNFNANVRIHVMITGHGIYTYKYCSQWYHFLM